MRRDIGIKGTLSARTHVSLPNTYPPKQGTGLDDLEENIVTLAEVLDLRGDPKGKVEGFILESKKVKGKGYTFWPCRAVTYLLDSDLSRQSSSLAARSNQERSCWRERAFVKHGRCLMSMGNHHQQLGLQTQLRSQGGATSLRLAISS